MITTTSIALSGLDDNLYSQWSSLWEECPNGSIYNHPEWLKICINVYGYTDGNIICVFNDDKLVGILALVKTKKWGSSTLSFPGENYTDKGCYLFIPELKQAVLAELRHILRKLPSVYLQEVDDYFIGDSNRIITNTIFIPSSVNHRYRFADNIDLELSSKQKKRFNKINIEYGQSIAVHEYWNVDLNIIEKLKDIEARSNKCAQNKDIFTKEDFIKLFTGIVKNMNQFIHVYILELNHTPIAYWLGFSYKKSFIGYNTAYDQQYCKIHPGNFLHYEAFKQIATRGYHEIDLSRGSNQTKKRFSNEMYFLYYFIHTKKPFVLFIWWIMTWVLSLEYKNPRLFNIIRYVKNSIIKK